VAPPELIGRPGVEFVGFIDKRAGATRFADFLAGCDVGCLFSDREALGISTLEFLRVGVPVAGFALEGPADTLPPDAGFRFPPAASAGAVADRLDAYLGDEDEQRAFAAAARGYAGQVTWDRCVREFQTVWDAGRLARPFRLVPADESAARLAGDQ
jgi:glycosyltransferase involved in cell wall biosynthesis